MAYFDLKNQACIVGVGESEYGRVLDDKSPVRLQTEALRAALADAGLTKDDIDGYNTSHGAPGGVDYDEFAMHTGMRFRWVNQNWNHGRWGSTSMGQAMHAVTAGMADYVVVTNTYTSAHGYDRYFKNRAPGRWTEAKRDVTGGHGEVDWAGLDTPGAATSLVARAYMEKYGATSEELGATSVAFRKHAQLNPIAIMRNRPMTLDNYMESRFISPPFRLFDYCLTNEGATALIVTTAERAKDLKKTPIYITGYQTVQSGRNDFIGYSRPGLPLGPSAEFDYVPEQQYVYGMADVKQSDVDGLYMYDSFSTNLWMVLERYGFCKAGEGHEFTQNGRIELGGELPVNTNGGLMSEGHYGGYNHMIEMVRQLRGECGPRQIKDAEVLQWATSFGDSMILTRG